VTEPTPSAGDWRLAFFVLLLNSTESSSSMSSSQRSRVNVAAGCASSHV